MVDKVVNTTLPPSCSLNPAASSTLMRPAESAASQLRCVIADLRHAGQVRSWAKVLPLRSVVVPVAVTCQHNFIAQVRTRPETHRWLAATSRCAGRAAFCEGQSVRQASQSGSKDTYATVSPSTMTLICHIARSPRPDIASDPTWIGRVHEWREMLNGLPSMTPGTKQVSKGFTIGTVNTCQSTQSESGKSFKAVNEANIPLPPPPSCTA